MKYKGRQNTPCCAGWDSVCPGSGVARVSPGVASGILVAAYSGQKAAVCVCVKNQLVICILFMHSLEISTSETMCSKGLEPGAGVWLDGRVLSWHA